MSQQLKTLTRTALALVEAFAINFILLFLGFQLFAAPWRTWIDDALGARLAPSVIAVAVTWFFILLTRGRYRLNFMPAATARRMVGATLLLPLVCFALSLDVLANEETLSLITPFGVATSLVAVLLIALLEEAVHRFVLMGLLLRAGAGPLVTVLLQALIFMLAHGRVAFTGPHAMTWYFSASLTLGVVYLATRRLWVVVLLHFAIDLLVAQTSPSAYWSTHRTVESLRFPWTDATATGWLALDALLLWRIAAGRASRPAASTIAPHGRHPRPDGELRGP